MELTYAIDTAQALKAFDAAPAVMTRHVQARLEAFAYRVAGTAKQKAPSLFSTLINSIHVEHPGELHFRVTTSVNYARAVEEGTGPAAGRKRYYPNPDNLRAYIDSNPRTRRFSLARAGSAKRGEQQLEVWFRSRALAWYIYQHGTKPHPYMAPALEAHRAAFPGLVAEGVNAGIAEAFGKEAGP